MVGRDTMMHGPGASLPGTKPGTDHIVAGGHDHPGPAVYIRVATILAIVTAVEVAIYYIHAFRGVLVPALLTLSVAKFVAVVGYFMHLKFDDRRFRWMFIAGLVIVMSVVGALLAMFWTKAYFHPPGPKTS
jgi:cytochrome c oxidase subunit 4